MTRAPGRPGHNSARRHAAGLPAVFAVCILAVATAAWAQPITLRDGGGGLELEGEYLGYDGRYLRLRTDHGAITLDYALFDCTGAACPDPEVDVPLWRISGAARIGEVLLPALVEGFAFSEGYVAERLEVDALTFSYALKDRATGDLLERFSFRLGTTDDGLSDLLADRADAAMAVREIRAGEREAAMAAGLGDPGAARQSRIVALDGLVPVVSPVMDRDTIDLAQLAAAFAGEAGNWSEFGGPDLAIRLHLTDADQGHSQGFVDRVLGPSGAEPAAGIVRHVDAAALVRAVAQDPGALGIVPFEAYGDMRPLTLSGRCGLRIAARRATLKTEDYPLTLPLFLYRPLRRLPPVAAEFMIWLRTERAQLVVRRAGFVDLAAEPIPLDAQGQRFAAAIESAGPEIDLAELQTMVAEFRGRERLSTTFRFESGSTRLGAQSRSNVYQLARALTDGSYAGQTLLLAGFSDGLGPAAANRALAGARAEAVLRELVAALGGTLPGDVRVRTRAFGEALPMGCDDTEWGRRINRRVELWVAE